MLAFAGQHETVRVSTPANRRVHIVVLAFLDDQLHILRMRFVPHSMFDQR